jgi:hypothetical protein
MLIAQQKQQENIAEYILYMYQIEDVIRAYQFDLDQLIKQFVTPSIPNPSFLPQYRTWYAQLISDMKSEKILKNGHRLELQELLVELAYLHNSLLSVMNDEKYIQLYESAKPILEDFIEKSNLKGKNHIEICFQALYMKLLMRIQKKEISPETENAFDQFRILIAYLSRAYKQMKNGDGPFWNN